MKRWIRVGAGVLVAVLGVGVGTVALAPYLDGPLGPIPGGALRGSVDPGAAIDWDSETLPGSVELEVDAVHPHSVRVGVVELRGALFVPATLRPERKRWSRTLLRDPRAVLRLAGRLHRVVAERVEDPGMFELLLERAVERYGPAYFARETTWFFELRPVGS